MKSLLSFWVLFSILIPLIGQSPDTGRYAFIRYDRNALIFPKGTQRFQPLFEKMQRLQNDRDGIVNIVHIGGSHVQAGVWTEGLFQGIASRIHGIRISRGLVFPYAAIGTTQPGDYLIDFSGTWKGCRNTQRNIDCPLGLMGIAATTTDSSARIKIVAHPGRSKALHFRRMKIFHAHGPESFRLIFPNDSLATYGRDSTDTYTWVELSRFTDTLSLQFEKTAPEQQSFSLYGIRLEHEQTGLSLDAIGNNGADLTAYLRCRLFEEQLVAVSPDLIILSLGINDAYTRHFDAEQYKKNYRALLEKIHSAAPDCAILFTTNNDSYYRRRYPNMNGVKVQQAILELADEYEAGVWDLFEVMGGHRSINQWVSAKLARADRIHFTHGGYLLIGDLLSEALVNAVRVSHLQPQSGG